LLSDSAADKRSGRNARWRTVTYEQGPRELHRIELYGKTSYKMALFKMEVEQNNEWGVMVEAKVMSV
jgi:hypothetical protein